MTPKRLVLILASTLLVCAYAVSIAPNFRHRSEWQRASKALLNLPHDRLELVVQAFTRDRKASGKSIPTAVPITELVSGGYLLPSESSAFDGTKTAVSMGWVGSNPQMILIRMEFPDGCAFAELADGSIQPLSK